MDQEFKHILITRFNVGLYSGTGWKNDKNGEAIDPDSWMKKRFELFERYCLPSVSAQTNKNFDWRVGFDIQTPEKLRKRILAYADACAQFNPVFLEKVTAQFISPIKVDHKDYPYLITTRLDNDDAISSDFISTVQDNFQPSDLKFINLNRGYVFVTETQEFRRMNFKSNPFISVIEKTENFKSILGHGNHVKIIENHPSDYFEIDDKEYWAQVIHENNLMNGIRGVKTEFNQWSRFACDFDTPDFA